MSNSITRSYSFANGGVADGGQLESEVANIVNTVNTADAGTTAWTVVKTATLQSTSSTTLKGTATNDSAAAGNIGEYIESVSAANVNAAATTVFDDLTSISLTAGDWDVTLIAYADNNGATWTLASFFIGIVAGNNSTGLAAGSNYTAGQWASSSTTPVLFTTSIPSYRMSLSSTTTVYLKRSFTFSAGTPRTSGGRLSGRRVR